MKKFWSIICTVIAITLSLCVFAACGGVKEADVDRLLAKCDAHEEISVRELLGNSANGVYIRVESDVYNVYIQENDFGSCVTLDYVRNSRYPVEYALSGQVNDLVEVHIIEQAHWNAESNKNNFLIVGIPENLMNDNLSIDVITKTGSVQIEDIERAQEIQVTVETGAVYIGDCHAYNTKVDVQTGAVYVETEGETANISTDTGAVKFDLAVKQITVTTNTGSINGKVEHPEYWYSIEAHSIVGKCNLNNRMGSGDYKLTVTTDTGSIKVRFDND